MGSIQLFAKYQEAAEFAVGLTGYVQLDLYEEEPIKFTKSIQTVEDPQATTSSFSRSFRIPHTSPNGIFMKAVFNVNSVDFNATKKSPAYINIDGAYFTSGNIRLQSIVRNDKENKIEYELIFMGETSTFSSNIGNKFLSQLNLSDLAHLRTINGITGSWEGNLKSGNVLYPLAEWGYTYDDNNQPEQPTFSVYNSKTSKKGFTVPLNPLQIEQFKPIIRTKYIWDKIFENSGFTYESKFLGIPGGSTGSGSNIFENLYTVMTDDDTSDAILTSTLKFSVGMENRQTLNLGSSINGRPVEKKMGLNLIYQDTTNSFDLTSGIFKVPITGQYDLFVDDMFVDYVYKNPGVNPSPYPLTIFRRNFKLGLKIFEYNLSGIRTLKTTLYSTGWVENLNANNRTKVYADYQSLGTKIKFPSMFLFQNQETELFFYTTSEQFDSFTILKGTFFGIRSDNYIDPTGLLPSNIKQIDFIKAINDRFKLMWEPDLQNPKNFKIEPWIDWIKNGVKKDWTNKLNENFDIQIDPLFYNYPRQYNFKDESEADLYNFSFEQENKKTFGQLDKDSGIEIITGKKEIKSIFSALPIAPIEGANNFLIPHFAKDTETERQPIQVKPRLCYYNGFIDLPVSSGATGWWMSTYAGTGSTGSVRFIKYPLISSFDKYPFNNDSFDLSWTNEKQYWLEPENGFSGRTNNTTYNNYWDLWYQSTYDPYSRIMTATFALDSTDISTLYFNDKIFVKDSWWLPLKIYDYSLGIKENIKVDLLKLSKVGVSIIESEPLNLIEHTNITKGATACDACCGINLQRYTLWNEDSTLESNIYYSDPTGALTIGSGWYSDGIDAVRVDERGVWVETVSCATCSCALTGLTALGTPCFGETLCDAVCCTTITTPVWGNGSTYATSTKLYPTPSGNAPFGLTPGWYVLGTDAVQIGEDGNTIVSTGLTTDCSCTADILYGPYTYVEYYLPSFYEAPVCGLGSTGFIGELPYWEDNQGLEYSNYIALTNNLDSPLNPGATAPPVYISDGWTMSEVVDGVATRTQIVIGATTCPGRTNGVTFNFTTSITSSFGAFSNLVPLISYDGYTFYKQNVIGASTVLPPLSISRTGYYSPGNLISFDIENYIAVGDPVTYNNISYYIVENGITGPVINSTISLEYINVTNEKWVWKTDPIYGGTGSYQFYITAT